MNYSVDIESLHKNFPAGFQVPSLLLEFGGWLATKPAGSLGDFSLESERFNDYWIENGADLHPKFAFFVRDPSGGQIGFWLYDGPTTGSPPIVLVGSEGELNTLSGSLEEFLQRLADGNTQAPDLDSRDQGSLEAAELAKLLNSRVRSVPIQSLRDQSNLNNWMEEWGRTQREWIDQDSLHMQLAEELRRFVKPDAQPWETANFDVLLVGTQFRMWHRSFGAMPMRQDNLSDLEGLFRAVREQRAKQTPERGLWFSSWVRVGSQGGATLCCNFMDQPQVLDERPDIPLSDYAIDLNAFPRSQHWMPDWLDAPLGR